MYVYIHVYNTCVVVYKHILCVIYHKQYTCTCTVCDPVVRVPGNIIHIHTCIPMHVVVDSRFIYSCSDLFQHGLLWMYMYMYRALCLEYRVSWIRVPPEAAHFF